MFSSTPGLFGHCSSTIEVLARVAEPVLGLRRAELERLRPRRREQIEERVYLRLIGHEVGRRVWRRAGRRRRHHPHAVLALLQRHRERVLANGAQVAPPGELDFRSAPGRAVRGTPCGRAGPGLLNRSNAVRWIVNTAALPVARAYTLSGSVVESLAELETASRSPLPPSPTVTFRRGGASW